MHRPELFLFSRRSIVGSLLAACGLVLHLVGLLPGLEWLPVTAGLYLAGLLLTPRERGLASLLGTAQDEMEIREGLDRLIVGLRFKVADDLVAKVAQIKKSIIMTLEIEGSLGSVIDPNVYLIRQTALAYLPDAFSSYLRMPRIIAERRAIAGGRTPHDVLLEQLDLMETRLADVADSILRHDSDRLLANGRFLAEKFGVSKLQVDANPTAGASEVAAGVQATAEVEAPAPGTAAEQERVR